MNDTLSKVLIFAAGAAIGSAVTWKLIKSKYERKADNEINDMMEHYRKREHGRPHISPMDEEPNDEGVISESDRIEYSKIASEYNQNVEEEMDDVEKPYVISPDEYGEFEDYETESLMYYADGVLADDDDNPIDDVDFIVGKDSLNHFGEYEDDSVFVRNDRTKTDYEILLSLRDYYPRPMEEE